MTDFLESLWYNLTSDTSESRTIVSYATVFLNDNNETIICDCQLKADQ